MPRMIDLIRESKVPSNVMRAAAHGALSLPPTEMIEILVYLTKNPVFAADAKMTLAGWDEASSIAAVRDRSTPQAVLDYFIAPENRRPKLLPGLLENSSVPEEALVDMAQTASREIVEMMLASNRVRKVQRVLYALKTNAHLDISEVAAVDRALASIGESTAPVVVEDELSEKTQWEIDHAAEIAAEEGKPFELIGGIEALEMDAASLPPESPAAPAPKAAAAVPTAVATAAAPAAEPPPAAAAPADAIKSKFMAIKSAETAGRDRRSALQKIQQMSVAERISLAFKGNKEERFILIRDGCKLVSQAVLESPKVSDAEVESFAAMKNVQESVLRGITMKHRYMKNYSIIRALTNNPRCPLDLSLTLMNHLLINDLRNLSMNKNVPETLRKMALKFYKQKSAPAGKKSE